MVSYEAAWCSYLLTVFMNTAFSCFFVLLCWWCWCQLCDWKGSGNPTSTWPSQILRIFMTYFLGMRKESVEYSGLMTGIEVGSSDVSASQAVQQKNTWKRRMLKSKQTDPLLLSTMMDTIPSAAPFVEERIR